MAVRLSGVGLEGSLTWEGSISDEERHDVASAVPTSKDNAPARGKAAPAATSERALRALALTAVGHGAGSVLWVRAAPSAKLYGNQIPCRVPRFAASERSLNVFI